MYKNNCKVKISDKWFNQFLNCKIEENVHYHGIIKGISKQDIPILGNIYIVELCKNISQYFKEYQYDCIDIAEYYLTRFE